MHGEMERLAKICKVKISNLIYRASTLVGILIGLHKTQDYVALKKPGERDCVECELDERKHDGCVRPILLNPKCRWN